MTFYLQHHSMIYKNKNDKLDIIKTKNLLSEKDSLRVWKDKALIERKTVAKHMCDKVLVSKILKKNS